VGCFRVCGLLNGIWLLYGMWAVEWYVCCCRACGLLDMRAAVYVGSCNLCGLLNGM